MNENYNKLVDDDYYKTTVSNTTTAVIDTSISNGYRVCDGGTLSLKKDIYEKFLESLHQAYNHKLMMSHLQLDISLTRRDFEGYLTEEELQEKQYEGRFWDLYGGYLYILVDDETLVVIEPNNKDVHIFGRDHLPESLKGRHYYE